MRAIIATVPQPIPAQDQPDIGGLGENSGEELGSDSDSLIWIDPK